MKDWKEYKFSDLVEIIGGGTPKTSVKEYWNGSIPWLSVKDFNNKNRYVYNTEKHITELGLKNSSTKLLNRNDVIISARGTVGEVAMLSRPMAFNQSCYGLKTKKIIKPKFLYYLILANIEKFKVLTHGSVFDTITRATFDRISVKIPSLYQQKQIVEILDVIDNKIQLNYEINDNLLQQIDCLYQALINVNSNSYLFFKNRNFRKISIYDIASIIYGAPFKSSLFNTDGEGRPIIRIRDLESQQFITYTTEVHKKEYLLQIGDIVVGMDGTFKPYIWGKNEALLNQRVCVFKNNRPKGKAFLYSCLRPLLKEMENIKTGTTVIHIGKKDFDSFEIPIPDEESLGKYDNYTQPLLEQYISNIQENTILSDIKKVLLKHLFR